MIDGNYGEYLTLIDEENLDDICHYGKGHKDGGHSGRYPWGSGDDRFQRPTDFYSFVRNNESKGLKETDIAKMLGMSTTELRAYKSVAGAMNRKVLVDETKKLEKEGLDGKKLTRTEIGKILGDKYNDGVPFNESTIRNFLNQEAEDNMNAAMNTAKFLMQQVDEKGLIDVGTMVNKEIGTRGVSNEKMNQALVICEAEGYKVLYGSVEQAGHPGQRTNLKILAPAGTPESAAYDYKNIHQIVEYSTTDNGKTFNKFEYPRSINPDRVAVRYAEDGGKEKDGVIEIRRGVKDLSLGKSTYAQVRILVDNGGGNKDRYLKGMAVYSDGKDMPDGVDIIFNTNKTKDIEKMDVFKKTKDNLAKDPNNPFGSTISDHGQSYYIDDNGERQLSLINKRSEEGEWSEWSKETASQFLGKQPVSLIKKQLNQSEKQRQEEFDDIMKVTNPTVKAKLLEDFADDCDASSIELKAAPLPGARYHVLLPSKTLKDNEIYAPNYPEGTQVALVRYPHGGTFEIPILTVNNHDKEGMEIIGPASKDAVAISSKAAAQLSGADFDGDTAIVIPTNNSVTKIKATPKLFDEFDTGTYGPDDIKEDANGNKHYYYCGKEYKHITERYKQIQMGVTTNLITDMTLQGASTDELERAVKHSMVIIDAYKHDLNYQRSYNEFNIKELHEKYQRHPDTGKVGGATTLLSRAANEKEVNVRVEGKYILDQEGNKDNGNELRLIDPYKRIYEDPKTGKRYEEKDKKTVNIDPKTGEKLYRETGEAYTKINYVTKDGEKLTVPAYVKVNDKYIRPRMVLKDYDLYYKDEDGSFVKVNKEKLEKSGGSILVKKQKMKVAQMQLTDDASKLSSGTIQERYYADYANKLKALANEARLEYLYNDSHPIPYSPEAKNKYKEEYKSLENKVALAEKNAPKERAANILATAIANEKIANSDQEMTKDEIQKLKQNELTKARAKYGAKNMRFEITEKEWEAVQAGAFSKGRLQQILRYADPDIVRKLATPKQELPITDTQIRRMKGLAASGETNAAIAKRLGVSVNTVIKYLGKED